MRRLAFALMISGLAPCSTGAAAPATALVLTGDGLTRGAKTITFSKTTRAEAIAVVTAVLGKPTETGNHGDCGQDVEIGFAAFRGGFELSFVKNRLSGWTADAAGLSTAKGIGVGSTVRAVKAAYPDVDIDPGDEANGGVGPSFQREGGPYGWIDGTGANARVTGLFAGQTCLAGI